MAGRERVFGEIMKQPLKPVLHKFPMSFVQLLPQDSYTRDEIVDLMEQFADNNRVAIADVKLGWDEDWTGYESCTVSLELSAVETPQLYELRKQKHKEDLAIYQQDLSKWQQYCKETTAQRAERKRLQAIEAKQKQIQKLNLEIRDLEKS